MRRPPPLSPLDRVRRAFALLGCAIFGHRFETRRYPINGWRSTSRSLRVATRCVRCGAVPDFHAPSILVPA